MNDQRAENRLTDSAWFWVALFALTGLLLTWAEGPKLLARRQQLIGRFYARQASGHAVMTPAVAAGQPQPLDEALGGRSAFVPIYVILASMLGYAGWRLWGNWRRSADSTATRVPDV